MSDEEEAQQSPGGAEKPEGRRARGDAAGKAGDDAEHEEEHVELTPEDKVRAARSDPLFEARGAADAITANHAFESFQRSVSAAGPVGVIGGATISGGMHIYAAPTSRHQPASGPVRADHLEQITSWYAAAPNDPEIRSILTDRRVVVVRGMRESGRTTTALKLLTEITSGQVSWLAADSLPNAGGDGIESGHGYLAELRTADHGLDEAALDRLSETMRQRKAYCILLPSAGTSGNGTVYVHDHVAPAKGSVVTARIEAAWRQVREDEAIFRETTTVLSRDPELWGLLGVDPGPAEEAWLADVIIRLADGVCDWEQALASWSDLIDRRIESWLADLPQGVDLHRNRAPIEEFAFRVSLAVLNDSPAHLVAEAGELLAFELFTTANPRLEPGRNVFAQIDEHRMAATRARLRDGVLWFGDASVPAKLMAYRDDRLPVRLLAAVWSDRPNLRRPILSWLQKLSQDRRPDVWMRAALAIGLVTSWDFAYCYHEAIAVWSDSEDVKQRLVAATALNQAARDENTRAAVNTVLRTWARADKAEAMWTAAVALGYGTSDVASVLRLVCRIGVWNDGELVLIASQSVADLFVRGWFAEVVSAVDGWIGDRRIGARFLGLLAILRLGDLRVRQVPTVEDLPVPAAARAMLADPSRADWPLLVALASVDGELGRRLVECVWQALSSTLVSKSMRDEIGDWIRAAEKSAELLAPLRAFLQALIDDQDDAARLLDLVDTLVENLDEPLAAPIAQAMRTAVHDTAMKQRG
ncbi:hypothetical protein ABIA35_008263 [Catenulispora sp. MAP12-49]|uniref:hypothetical protein n=1 Tax=unclassified Catenulispora TaxID=414885 RepID=UPI003514BB78